MKVLFKKYNQEFNNEEIEVFNAYLRKSFQRMLKEDKPIEICKCQNAECEPYDEPKEENA